MHPLEHTLVNLLVQSLVHPVEHWYIFHNGVRDMFRLQACNTGHLGLKQKSDNHSCV